MRAAAVIWRHQLDLGIGTCHNDVGAAAQHLVEHEFELARLVAAKGKPGQVIALDQHIDLAERLGKTRARLERCRQMGQRDARYRRQPARERFNRKRVFRHRPYSPSGMPVLPVP